MSRIDTKRGRDQLEPRREPYWGRVAAGRYLGFRKTGDTPSGAVGTWIARYRRDDGGQKYEALGELADAFGFDEARAEAEKRFADLAAGVQTRDDSGRPRTVADACAEYVEDRRKAKGDRPADAAACFFERRVYGRAKSSRKREVKADPIAAVRLDRLRTRNLSEFRDRLLASGVARQSVRREMTHLLAALNLAVRNGWLGFEKTAVWRSLSRLEAPETRRDLYLDRNQRRALLKAATGAVRDLMEAAALTGCRAGELVSARRSAFDERTQTLTVEGKTGRRTFPLAPAAVALFARVSKSKLPTAYLLTRDDGEPWAHSSWDEAVRAAAAEAELPSGTCLYTLRHSFITEMLVAGMSTLEVAKMVGTSLRMIEKHYGHLAQSSARKHLAKVKLV
jgi:integrase